MSWVWSMEAGAHTGAFSLVADRGVYTLTGRDAGERLVGEPGDYVLTGHEASLEFGRAVLADAGAFLLTGHEAGGAVSVRMQGDRAEYALSGANAVMRRSKVPITDPEPYVEQEWVQPADQNLSADVVVEQG